MYAEIRDALIKQGNHPIDLIGLRTISKQLISVEQLNDMIETGFLIEARPLAYCLPAGRYLIPVDDLPEHLNAVSFCDVDIEEIQSLFFPDDDSITGIAFDASNEDYDDLHITFSTNYKRALNWFRVETVF